MTKAAPTAHRRCPCLFCAAAGFGIRDAAPVEMDLLTLGCDFVPVMWRFTNHPAVRAFLMGLRMLACPGDANLRKQKGPSSEALRLALISLAFFIRLGILPELPAAFLRPGLFGRRPPELVVPHPKTCTIPDIKGSFQRKGDRGKSGDSTVRILSRRMRLEIRSQRRTTKCVAGS